MLDTASLEKLDAKQLEQLRALTDPLRLRLFTVFREPMTVTKAAATLGVERSSLYYHLRVLLKTDLVKEIETHHVGNLKESVYQQAVESIDFTRSSYEEPGPIEPYLQVLMGISHAVDEDCRRSLSRGGNLKAAVTRKVFKIKSEKLDMTPKRISKLMREFMKQVKELGDEDGDVEYSVSVTHFEM